MQWSLGNPEPHAVCTILSQICLSPDHHRESWHNPYSETGWTGNSQLSLYFLSSHRHDLSCITVLLLCYCPIITKQWWHKSHYCCHHQITYRYKTLHKNESSILQGKLWPKKKTLMLLLNQTAKICMIKIIAKKIKPFSDGMWKDVQHRQHKYLLAWTTAFRNCEPFCEHSIWSCEWAWTEFKLK